MCPTFDVYESVFLLKCRDSTVTLVLIPFQLHFSLGTQASVKLHEKEVECIFFFLRRIMIFLKNIVRYMENKPRSSVRHLYEIFSTISSLLNYLSPGIFDENKYILINLVILQVF
jgi:hypothetical protein